MLFEDPKDPTLFREFSDKVRKIPCVLLTISSLKGVCFIHHCEEDNRGKLLGLKRFEGQASLVTLTPGQVTTLVIG